MEYATFRKWLSERGCRFDTQREERGEGHGTVTIYRGGADCGTTVSRCSPRTRRGLG